MVSSGTGVVGNETVNTSSNESSAARQRYIAKPVRFGGIS